MASFSQFELPSSSIHHTVSQHSNPNSRESDELMSSFAHQQQEQSFIESSNCSPTNSHQHQFQQHQVSGYYMSIGNCKKCFNQPCTCLLHDISDKNFTLQQDALVPRFEQLDQFESHQQSSFRCDSSIAFNELSTHHYQGEQDSSFQPIGRVHQELHNAQVDHHMQQKQISTLHSQQEPHFQQLHLQSRQQRQQQHISSHTDNQQLISSCSNNFSNDSSLQTGDQKFTTYNYKEHDNWTHPRAPQMLNNYTTHTFQTDEQQVIDNADHVHKPSNCPISKNESNTATSFTYLQENNATLKNFNTNEMNDFNNNNNSNSREQNLPYSSVSPKLQQNTYNQIMKVQDIPFQGSNFHPDCIQHTTDFQQRYEYNQQSLDNYKVINGDLHLDEVSSQALSSTNSNQNSYEQHSHLHQNQTYQPLENLYNNLPEQSVNRLEHQNQEYKRQHSECTSSQQQQQRTFDQQTQPQQQPQQQPQPLQPTAYTSLQQLAMNCDDYPNQVSTTTTFRVDCQANRESPTNSNATGTNTVANSKTRPLKGRRGRPRKKGIRSKNKVNGKLWEFIRDLLLNEHTNPSFIRWERREDGVFKFVQSDKVAKMWGERKQNPKMTYEKLSRAMRYYYKSKVLLPVFGRRLVYKFGPNATGWLPSEADMLY